MNPNDAYCPSPDVAICVSLPAVTCVLTVHRCRVAADDGTAKRICWLLTECCLSAHQPAQALDAVRFIETKFVTKPEDARKKVRPDARLGCPFSLCYWVQPWKVFPVFCSVLLEGFLEGY